MPVKTGPLSPLEQVDLYSWSLNRRNIRGADFSIIPPLKHFYRDQAAEVYVEKAAQLFVSEYFVNLALFAADTKWGDRGNVIYFFPSTPQITDFSAARLDPVINMSPYLVTRQSAVKEVNQKAKIKQNVGLKQVGGGMIYLRGTKSRTQMISVDADVIILDEIDEMAEGAVEAAKERLGSAMRPFIRGGSTPRLPNRGVDAIIKRSTNKCWLVTCTRCKHEHDLALVHDFMRPLHGVAEYKLQITEAAPEIGTHFHIGSEYYVGCPNCGQIINVWNGRWVNSKELSMPNVDFEGYHLPKLFSNRLSGDTFDKIAINVQKERDGRLSDAATQEFYNSVLGLPRAPAGVQLNWDHIHQCRAANGAFFNLGGVCDFQHGTGYLGIFKRCYLGTDVGSKKLHTTILAYPADNPHLYEVTDNKDKPVVVFAGSVPEFADIKKLFFRYDCVRGVIDTMPEYHSSMNLCKELPGRMYGSMYPFNWTNKGATIWNFDEDKMQVQTSRSDSLSNSLSYVFENQIVFPYNVDAVGGYPDDAGIGEFPKHLMAVTKTIDEKGQVIYINAGDDHFAHSLNYAMIAAKASPLDTSDIINPANLMDAMFALTTNREESSPVLPALTAIKRGNYNRVGLYGSRRAKAGRRASGY